MNVRYGLWLDATRAYEDALRALAEAHPGGRWCDVGAGAQPTFTQEDARRLGMKVTLLDISPSELAKAPPGFDTLVADISDPNLAIEGTFDVACSRMLAEHVTDAEAFHSNVRNLLRPGGIAVHFFPTLWALPFVVNRLTPERLSRWLLHAVGAGRDAKFPAHYHMCRGPSRSQTRRLEALGFEVVEYHAFFGHAYYARAPHIQALQERWASWLVRRPVPLLTSHAVVVLRRR